MERSSTDRWVTLGLFAGSLSYFFSYYDVAVNWMDEGWLLMAVERILSGQVAYRDFYEFYTPGRWYLFAGLFKLFGHQFLIVRIVWAFGLAVEVALIFKLARKVLPISYSLIPAMAVLLAPGPWQKTPFTLSMVVGIWLVVWYSSRPSLKRAAVMGIGSALILLFRQDTGVFFACLGGLFVLIKEKDNKLKSVAVMAAGYLLFTSIWVGWFIAQGAGPELLRQVVFAGAKGFSTNPIPFPGLFEPLPEGISAVNIFLMVLGRAAFYMPFLIIPAFFFAWYMSRADIKANNETVFWSILAFALMLAANQFRARSDFPHLWQAYPVISLMAAMVIATLGLKNRVAAIVSTIVFLAIVGGASFSTPYLHHGSPRVIEGRSVPYSNPRMPVMLTPIENKLLKEVEDMIRKYVPPRGYVFLAPDMPIFYFLTDTRNPTPWDVVRPSFLWGEEDQAKAASLIESSKTRLVVIRDPDLIPVNEVRFSDTYPLLNSYIMENYHFAERIDDFRFYLKNSE